MFKVAVLVLAFVGVTFAALAVAPLDTLPKKYEGQEGCYIKELDVVIPYGASISSNNMCMEYRCYQDFVQYMSCVAVLAVDPCVASADSTKAYPDCCPKIECPTSS